MKKRELSRREKQSKTLTGLMEHNPEARLIENRYRAMRYVLRPYFPELDNLPNDTLDRLFSDVVYMDRKIRHATEGIDEEKKEILSQEFQLRELV